jgi:hypothetical protein
MITQHIAESLVRMRFDDAARAVRRTSGRPAPSRSRRRRT